MDKNLKKVIISVITLSAFVFGYSSVAASVLQGYQGGTGLGPTTTSTCLGEYLQFTSTTPFVTYQCAPISGGASSSFITAINGVTSTVSGQTTTVSLALNGSSTQQCSGGQAVNLLTSNGLIGCISYSPSTTIPTTYVTSFGGQSGVITTNASTGIAITNTGGIHSIQNTGVTSAVAGGCVTVSNATGTVTLGSTCLTNAPATTTINGTQSPVFLIQGDGISVTSTVNGSTTIFSTIGDQGESDYYFTSVASDLSSTLVASDTPQASLLASTTASGLTNGTTSIQKWSTQLNVPSLPFIAAGLFDVHIDVAQTAGTKPTFLYATVNDITSTGTVVSNILTTENSPVLTGTLTDYDLLGSLSIPYEMASTTDRIQVNVIASVSGALLAPTIQIYYGGTSADSRLELPASTVDITNFVPYTGAVKNVNLGTNTISSPSIPSIATTSPTIYDNSPTATDDVPFRLKMDATTTLQSVECLNDNATGTFLFNITWGTTRFATTNNAFTSAQTCSATSTAATITLTGSTTIQNGSIVRMVLSGATSTGASVQIDY